MILFNNELNEGNELFSTIEKNKTLFYFLRIKLIQKLCIRFIRIKMA